MTSLVDLPNELLEEILLLATCGDQRQLIKAAVKWQGENEFEIELLALHLLRYPSHRPLVRTLEFTCLSTLDVLERSPHWSSRAKLRPETLAELAEAARRTIPDLADSTNWCYCIQRGCTDAIAALILAWATQVTEVKFTLPPWTAHISVHNSNGIIMQFIDWAARNTSTGEKEDSPLANVRHLEVEIATNGGRDTELPMSIFKLPRLRVLIAFGLKINGSNNISIPEHRCAIKTLCLENSEIIGNGLWGIIGACEELLVLSISLSDRMSTFPSKRAISNAIRRQAGSLKELSLDFYTWRTNWLNQTWLNQTWLDEPQLVSNHEEIPYHRNFQCLSKLESLTIDVEDLRSSPEDQITPDFFSSRLPLSLRSVSIKWKAEEHMLQGDVLTSQADEENVYLDVAVAIKSLAIEAGTGQRNLLTCIWVPYVLWDFDEVHEAQVIATENGVAVYGRSYSDANDDPLDPLDWITDMD